MRRLGCRGAAAGLLSALPRHSSCSIVPIPMPYSSPISIPGAALENISLVLVAKDALELAPLPSPGFYSLLLVVLLTSGSWRSVITLSHLIRFVVVSHFQLGSIQSVLLSVSQGDWLASFDLREAYLPVPVHPASRPFLRFLLRDTVYQFQTLLWPLHGSAGLHLGHGSCFSYTPFSGYPYASIPRPLAGPVFFSGVSPRGSSDCPPTLSRFGDCHPSHTSYLPG